MTTRLPGKDRGNQIRERFPGAGAGLDDQVLLFGERAFHRLGHLELAVAEFVVGVPLGKQAFFSEELANGQGFGGRRHYA